MLVGVFYYSCIFILSKRLLLLIVYSSFNILCNDSIFFSNFLNVDTFSKFILFFKLHSLIILILLFIFGKIFLKSLIFSFNSLSFSLISLYNISNIFVLFNISFSFSLIFSLFSEFLFSNSDIGTSFLRFFISVDNFFSFNS